MNSFKHNKKEKSEASTLEETLRGAKIKWTIEIIPKHAVNLGLIPVWVEGVYITMIPEAKIGDVIEATRKVLEKNRIPIPHIAARCLKNENQFKGLLDALTRLGVKRLLLIGGGVDEVQGPYSCVMDLLQTGWLEHFGINEIGIAGHPEGNPSDNNSENSLLSKVNWAAERGVKLHIVTQWSFNTTAVNTWICRLRELGVRNPIHVGIPGPTTLKTLLRFGKLCGVKVSSHILKKQGLNLGKLLFINKPDSMVAELEGYQQLHLFPFGGLTNASEWLSGLVTN